MDYQSSLYTKMCKKIAQLTRVIFILNTKSDELDTIIENILEGFDNEYEKMSADSASYVKSLKSTIDKVKKQAGKSDKVADIKTSYDKAVKQFNDELNSFKSEFKKAQAEYHNEIGGSYEKVVASYNSLKTDCEKKILEYKSKFEEMKTMLANEKRNSNNKITEELAKQRKQFEKEKSEMKNENEAAKAALIAKNKEEIDSLRADYEVKIKELNNIIKYSSNSTNEEIEQLRKKLQETEKVLKAQINDEQNKSAELSGQLLKATAELMLKEKNIDSLKKQSEEYEREIVRLIKELNDALDQIKSKESLNSEEFNSIRDKLVLSEEKVKVLEGKLIEVQEEYANYEKWKNKEIEDLMYAHESALKELTSQTSYQRETLEEKVRQLTLDNNELRERLASASKQNQNLALLENEIRILKRDLAEAKESAELLKVSLSRQAAEHKQELESIENRLKEELSKNTDDQLAALMKQQKSEIEKIKHESYLTFNDMKNKLETEVSTLKMRIRELELELEKLTNQMSEERERLEGSLQRKYKEIIEGKDEEISKLKDRILAAERNSADKLTKSLEELRISLLRDKENEVKANESKLKLEFEEKEKKTKINHLEEIGSIEKKNKTVVVELTEEVNKNKKMFIETQNEYFEMKEKHDLLKEELEKLREELKYVDDRISKAENEKNRTVEEYVERSLKLEREFKSKYKFKKIRGNGKSV